MNRQGKTGVDAGGTLIKIARFDDNGQLDLVKFPTLQMLDAVSWIKDNAANGDICMTGGKAAQLHKLLPGETKTIIEFEATCSGVIYLLNGLDRRPDRFVLTNVGTGTSIHWVDGDNHMRIGGTGVGGGTMMGLSRLLAGIDSFDEIVRLAGEGVRDKLDLKVSHIYEDGEPPIAGNLTASNFGHLPGPGIDLRPSDYLASVLGLVGETVSTMSALAARRSGADTVVYIGSSFLRNTILKEIVVEYTRLREAEPLFVENGEFSGAVGALLSLQS